MMERSYDEPLIKDKSMCLEGEAETVVQIAEHNKLTEIADCNAGDEITTKQIFDFGAEIATTNSMMKEANHSDDDDREVAMKTSKQKIKTNDISTAGESDKQESQQIRPVLPYRLKKKCSKDNVTENDKNEPKKVHPKDDDDSSQSGSGVKGNSRQQNHAPSKIPNGEEDDEDEEDDDSEDDEEDAESGSISDSTNYSEYSDMSDMSGREWKPISARPVNWVQKQMHSGANPLDLISQIVPSSASVHAITNNLNENTLWRILASLMSEPPRRQKLPHVNTFDDVISLVLQSKNIIVLTGAGVSVSCGIPDFRSADGIYSRLNKDFPDLPDPQAMFDINYFSRDPRPFFKFAREIYPGQFRPSPCHRFIRLLEQKQKLLRNYTQNIDTLEQVAGIRNVIECHGSFSTASCTKCKYKCDADAIRDDIFEQRIPVCPHCQPHVRRSVDARQEPVPVSEFELRKLVLDGIMKPDIVFFGEGLPDEFHTVMASDKDKCDLLIVMGSSLKVRPVALIPSSIPADVPQILINREQLHHLEFDVELLGDSDVIINQLCHRLGATDAAWKTICYDEDVMRESKKLLSLESFSGDDEEDTDEDTETEETVAATAERQLLQDNDTQSVKSNASTDIALRSSAGGAYSDSGFESSTSSGAVIVGGGGCVGRSDLEPPQALAQIKSDDLLQPPDFLASGDVGLNDFGNPPGFHPFAERLGQPAFTAGTSAPAIELPNNRHLSVDSSKDSGIQGDASSLTSSGESVRGTINSPTLSPPVASAAPLSPVVAPTATKFSAKCNSNSRNNSLSSSSESGGGSRGRGGGIGVAENENAKCLTLHRSAGERLHEGTYYCHESSASYVFPGAQVAWSSDSEEELEAGELVYVSGSTIQAAEEASAETTFIQEDAQTDAAPITQFDGVNETTSTNEKIPPTAITTRKSASKKRHSATMDKCGDEVVAATAASTTCCTITQISNTNDDDDERPPIKKHCEGSTLMAAVASVALNQIHAEASTSSLLQQL